MRSDQFHLPILSSEPPDGSQSTDLAQSTTMCCLTALHPSFNLSQLLPSRLRRSPSLCILHPARRPISQLLSVMQLDARQTLDRRHLRTKWWPQLIHASCLLPGRQQLRCCKDCSHWFLRHSICLTYTGNVHYPFPTSHASWGQLCVDEAFSAFFIRIQSKRVVVDSLCKGLSWEPLKRPVHSVFRIILTFCCWSVLCRVESRLWPASSPRPPFRGTMLASKTPSTWDMHWLLSVAEADCS